MTIIQTLMSLGPTIDMIWVWKPGDATVAAVTVSRVVAQLAQGVMMGFTTGMRALIARAMGANDMETANHVAQQAVVISAAYAVVKASALLPRTLRLWRLGQQTSASSLSVGRPSFPNDDRCHHASFGRLCQSHVDRNCLSMLPYCSVSALDVRSLDVHETRRDGAAYTGVIAQSLGAFLGLDVLLGARSRVKLSFTDFVFDVKGVWRIGASVSRPPSKEFNGILTSSSWGYLWGHLELQRSRPM